MLAASHAFDIFHYWLALAGGVLGVLLTAGTLYIRVIHPRAQEHKIHEAERANLRQQLQSKIDGRNDFLDGVAEVPGMTPAVPPAAVRVRVLEDFMRSHMDAHAKGNS